MIFVRWKRLHACGYLPPEKGTRESIYIHPGEPCSLDILPETIELMIAYEHQ